MPSPRNGGESPPTPPRRIPSHQHHAQSTVALQKLQRFNALILVFRLVTFCFSLSSFVFMLTISEHSDSPSWYRFNAFRFVVAANATVAVYSMLELGAVVWEISRGTTVFPETLQVWIDFGHDQAFTYMALAADAAGAELALRMKETDMCGAWSSFCVQSDISVALGFVGFLFLAFSSLLSGFRALCFFIHGSRFHV